MPLDRYLTALPILALMGLVAAGLVVRGRVGLCWSFAAYLLVILVTGTMAMSRPDPFTGYPFWSQKETALFVMKVLIAFEIGVRNLSIFPRARVRVGLVFVGVLLATAVAVWAVPYGGDGYAVLVGMLSPRQQAGALWLFAVVGAAAVWYRVPLHPLHRAILAGLASYLAIGTLILTFVGRFKPPESTLRWFVVADAAAFLAVLSLWTWVAWKPLRAPSPIVAKLQPWARSW